MSKYILILFLAFTAGSCSLVKKVKREKVDREIHHYHDSTHFLETQTIREIHTASDSTKAYFWLEELIKKGYLKSVDRNFTTEIRYKDGGLEVSTYMDSLLQRITEIERELSNTKSQQTVVEHKDETIKDTEKKNKFPWIISAFLAGVLLIVVFGVYVYVKVSKPRIF